MWERDRDRKKEKKTVGISTKTKKLVNQIQSKPIKNRLSDFRWCNLKVMTCEKGIEHVYIIVLMVHLSHVINIYILFVFIKSHSLGEWVIIIRWFSSVWLNHKNRNWSVGNFQFLVWCNLLVTSSGILFANLLISKSFPTVLPSWFLNRSYFSGLSRHPVFWNSINQFPLVSI